MKKVISRHILLSLLAVATLTMGQIATMDAALAKSAHCGATPVPGQPGHFIVTCSRTRP